MSERISFYKIVDPEALAKIDAFFDKRDAVYKQIAAMCEKYGFEHHITHDSIQNGIRFWNMSADPEKEVIDKKLWKTSKHSKSGFLNILPRATAKAHKAEYEAMIPERLFYTELNKIILGKDITPWSKSYGFSWKKGEYFKFKTSLEVSPLAVEILGSEYAKEAEGGCCGKRYFRTHLA